MSHLKTQSSTHTKFVIFIMNLFNQSYGLICKCGKGYRFTIFHVCIDPLLYNVLCSYRSTVLFVDSERKLDLQRDGNFYIEKSKTAVTKNRHVQFSQQK